MYKNPGDSCECLSINQCQWSQKALSSVIGLPRNDPKVKEQTQLIQKYICDPKERLVYCCGSAQLPPTYVDINIPAQTTREGKIMEENLKN